MTLMPKLASLGFTEAQATNQFSQNRDLLKTCRPKTLTDDIAVSIWNMILERGSVLNCGGYHEMALQIGCSADQVKEICDEIFATFDDWDAREG